MEFRPGALARAAADGTIAHVTADSQSPGRFTIRINHTVGQANYATDYTNITGLAAGISAGAAVSRGQALGSAGVQTQLIGSSQVTWAMTHFQFNDFARNEGLTNPNAVSPEPYLSPGARSLFDELWRTAAYSTEWCEPFPTNSRAAGFPLSRTWTRQSGSLAERLDVRCPSSDTTDYEYTFRGEDGAIVESGVLRVAATAKPLPTIDVRASSGTTRLGVYDIASATLQVALGAPGGARPASLESASAYTTQR